MFENLINFYDSFLPMGVPGFDLAVYLDGECILRHKAGFSDLENRVPIRGDERYNIYSCSKPITCVAAMQLWEKGLFSLEDRLSDYMEEFAEMHVKMPDGTLKKAENPILIRHLFEMTAGFNYDTCSPAVKTCRQETDGACQTRDFMRYLAREPLCFEPGAQWNYSLCHDVLAALVEVITGKRFGLYVQKNIFEPLGMTQSTFLLPEEEISTLAGQYRFTADRQVQNVGRHIGGYKFGYAYESGGAGAISSVDDYIKFLEALRIGDKILARDTVTLMATDRLSDGQRATYNTRETHGYGLGVRTPKPEKTPLFTEFGWGGAAGAYLSVDRTHGLSIYHAQHMLSSPNQAIRGYAYRFVMAELFGHEGFKKQLKESPITENYTLTY